MIGSFLYAREAASRRGMLLLLVLSILALFIVVGAVGILVAIRARETAIAFAQASSGQAGSASLARAQLDEALLRLIRGGTPTGGITESLLADKYGPPQYCAITSLAGSGQAIITATINGLDLSNPAMIAGRVLTLVPRANDSTGPTSYRILRTGTVPNTVLLANVKPTTPFPLPVATLAAPCEGVLNGREFSGVPPGDINEPFDAFDANAGVPAQNPFLTQPVLQGSTVARIAKPAFGSPGETCQVDNDGDGVLDGTWIVDALPRQRSPDGGELSFDVSYLVLDLDGRVNLNAHGSLVRAQEKRTSEEYPHSSDSVSIGLGYGPADVDAALLVTTQAEAMSASVPARWAMLLQGGPVTKNAASSAVGQWRPTPYSELQHAGRYGLGPGIAQPGGATITGTNSLHSDFWIVGNSPTDLKARLQVFTEGAANSPPTLRFARPNNVAWAATDNDDRLGAGTAAHPYRMRLDEDAPRGGGVYAFDEVFTLGELERLLRPFDADAVQLAPRLAALLDDFAERSRMTVTTDSWDTPAITGSAAMMVMSSGTIGAGIYNVQSPDVVAGLRFNVNRPIVSGSTQREYFRHLYTMIVTLTGTGVAAEAAQWAANVVEFRDPDSIMSWYPYDPNPLDGVWSTGTGVWGMERPEMVITEATASGDQVSVRLFRPWAATCTGANSVPTEVIDPSLGVSGTVNTLDATKVVAGGSGSTAVWRVTVGGSSSGLDQLLTSATAVTVNSQVGSGPVTVRGSKPAEEVVLQRLADPLKPLGAVLDADPGSGTNAYVDVHRVRVPLTERSVSRWLHWPNRDLVSHGELLTVPSGIPGMVPEALFAESQDTSLARRYPIILDATIVPSRFVGAHVSVASGTSYLRGTGYENFQYGHFSRWREAGRVNINTILPNIGNTPETLDNAVWTALVGRPGLTNPALTQPVTADRDLLVTGNDAMFPRSSELAASSFLKRSTAIRLANAATIRSNVFAVWITLRINDSANEGTPQYARLFSIVDRSIPVGYAPGRTLNVRESIRLQRFLE